MFSSTATWSARQLGVQVKVGASPDAGVIVTAPLHAARLGPLELLHRVSPPRASTTSAARGQVWKLTRPLERTDPRTAC